MNVERIKKIANNLMSNEGYATTYLGDYIDASIEAKENLRQILSHHPNWDEENGWIHFSYDSERRIDMEILRRFCNWFTEYLPKMNPQLTDLERSQLCGLVRAVTYNNNFGQFPPETLAKKEGESDAAYTYRVTRNDVLTIANDLLKAKQKGHVTRETRISKIIMKVAKAYGITAYSDIRKGGYYGENGYVQTEKDYGWNYQFSQFADAINPLKVKRHTLISINPIDFLTMSWGDNWVSCHDTRDSEDPGCYSAGTMSYGMDDVSMIFYYCDQSYADDSDFCSLPKQKRCVFCWGEGKLLQSRVYPDGRDGGDFGLAEETRSIVQKIMADCLDIPNLWDLVKGKEHIKSYAVSRGYQYPDYRYYDDCTTSYPKAYGEHNTNKLNIGKYGICPECGSEIDHEKNILCSSCSNSYEYWCLQCDAGIADGDGIYIDGVGDFCCEECANRYGYYEIDGDWWDEDELRIDDYTDEKFGDTSEMVETEEGHVYMNEYNARQDDCAYCEDDGKWHSDGHYYVDALTGEAYHEELNFIDGEYYTDESAEEAGYVLNDNGEWEEKVA